MLAYFGQNLVAVATCLIFAVFRLDFKSHKTSSSSVKQKAATVE